MTDITITAGTSMSEAVTLLNTEVPPAPVDLTSVIDIIWQASGPTRIMLRKRYIDSTITIINATGNGGGINTTLAATAYAGQPIITVASTTGFILGGTVYILDTISGIGEVAVIGAMQSDTLMTMTANLQNEYPLADTSTVTQISVPQFLIPFAPDDTSPAFGVGLQTETVTYGYEIRIVFGDSTQEVVLTGNLIIPPSESAGTEATIHVDSVVWGIF
jgi:hypothetical protein